MFICCQMGPLGKLINVVLYFELFGSTGISVKWALSLTWARKLKKIGLPLEGTRLLVAAGVIACIITLAVILVFEFYVPQIRTILTESLT